MVIQACVNAGFCGISDLSRQAFYDGLVTVAAPSRRQMRFLVSLAVYYFWVSVLVTACF